jgi:hypothetical protein
MWPYYARHLHPSAILDARKSQFLLGDGDGAVSATATQHAPLPYPVPRRWGGKPQATVSWVFIGFFAAVTLLMLFSLDGTAGSEARVLLPTCGALMMWSWGTGRRAVRRLPQQAGDRYFVGLRRVPSRLVVGFLLVAALWAACAVLAYQVAIERDDASLGFILMLGAEALVSALLAAAFLGFALSSFITFALHSRWGRNGLWLTSTGVSVRLPGTTTLPSGQAEVTWDNITSIEAVQKPSRRKTAWSMGELALAWNGGATVIRSSFLGVSPVVLYEALRFYRQYPAARAELSTSVARDRMTGWLRAFLSAR